MNNVNVIRDTCKVPKVCSVRNVCKVCEICNTQSLQYLQSGKDSFLPLTAAGGWIEDGDGFGTVVAGIYSFGFDNQLLIVEVKLYFARIMQSNLKLKIYFKPWFMKKHQTVLGLLALTLAFTSCGPSHVVVESGYTAPAPAPPPPPPPAPEVSYQSFYDQLSPYGQWIENPTYGYVFLPDVGPDFKPYTTNGHWVYTDAGWTWASDYPWGWATFHYGRWFYEDGYGWMWIPGQEWAPAWVSWRTSQDYYGWAPLGPSVSISIAVGGGYNPPAHYWSFVPHQYVTSPQINNYYVSEQKNVTIINNTTVINNTVINNNVTNNNIRNTNITNNNITNNNVTNNNVTNNVTNNNITNNRVNNTTVNNYAGGPDPNEVSRYTGVPLRPVPLQTSSTPGEKASANGLAIYRPKVTAAPQNNSGSGGQARPAPVRVQPLSNVKPVNTAVYNGGNNGSGVATRPVNTGFPTSNPPGNEVNTRPAASITRPVTNNNEVAPDNRPVTNPVPKPAVAAPVTNPALSGANNNRPVNQQPAAKPNYQPNGQPVVKPANQQASAPGFNSNKVQPSAVPAKTNNPPKPVQKPRKPAQHAANRDSTGYKKDTRQQ
jgi:uncharacterized protein DUF6600